MAGRSPSVLPLSGITRLAVRSPVAPLPIAGGQRDDSFWLGLPVSLPGTESEDTALSEACLAPISAGALQSSGTGRRAVMRSLVVQPDRIGERTKAAVCLCPGVPPRAPLVRTKEFTAGSSSSPLLHWRVGSLQPQWHGASRHLQSCEIQTKSTLHVLEAQRVESSSRDVNSRK
ncbi:hypothetical protein NDU88_001180 [Pleurodeles waltl]|uniref:Uncharacterized protein n=1 Tax=Pleurodeles waltl TaxID=8319 RepID=A0AAV7NBV0_PLEWA|nr:hypothetical protein NDU88_001180 [Pleurodeles waltl]